MNNYSIFTVHRTPTGHAGGYKEMLEAQARAGFVPAMTVDEYGVAFEALEVARAHDAEHFICYRALKKGDSIGYEFDVPGRNYTQDAETAAREWFQAFMDVMPPEFDPAVRVVVFNEPDKNRLDYVAEVGLEIAKRLKGLGMSSVVLNLNAGEPEFDQWQQPHVIELLRYVEANPTTCAIGLHEYSYSSNLFDPKHEADGKKYQIGRWWMLEDTCKRHGIDFNRIPIGITEFGPGRDLNTWPGLSQAAADIDRAAAHYGERLNIRMAAWWVVSANAEWGGLGNEVAKLIPVIEDLANAHAPAPIWNPGEAPTQPPAATIDEAMIRYANAMFAMDGAVMPLNKSAALQAAMFNDNFTPIRGEDRRQYNGESFAVQLARTTFDDRVRVYRAKVGDWANVDHTDGVLVDGEVVGQTPPPEPPTRPFAIRAWPCDRSYRVTQGWGARKEYYSQFGWSGGHEGIDFGVPLGMPYFAVDDGVVERVTDKRSDGQPSAYGWHVIIRHANGFRTLHGHARADVPVRPGQQVRAGDVIAYSGNTGNSTGPHLHFSMLRDGVNSMPSFPPGYIDPTPYLWPPQIERVDLRPYFLGRDARIQWVLTNEWGSGEDLQRQDTATGWRLVKNRNAEYFRFTERDGRAMIGRTLDTSMGGGRVYTLRDEGHDESAWCPAEMAVGEVFTRSPIVTVYEENGCRLISQNQAISNIRFLGRLDRFNNRDWVQKNDLPLIELDDCVILQWENMAGDPLEQYVGSMDRGYFAGWKRQHNDPNSPGWSVITEINRDRAPLVPRAVPCGIKV